MKNQLRRICLSSTLATCALATPALSGLFISHAIAAPNAVASAEATAPEIVAAVTARAKELGNAVKLTQADGKITEILVSEGSQLTEQDAELFGKVNELTRLQIINCRALNNEWVNKLTGLKNLTSLSITNTVIDDEAVKVIVQAFPDLTYLDLSSNANMSSGVMRTISELKSLQRLLMIQTRLNEISTRRLRNLTELQVLDLRGNMEAGNMSMQIVGGLPKLKAFKHRSTSVTDAGVEHLANSETLENLFIQDFAITDTAGPSMGKMSKLSQLEIFRCQGFGDQGVIALKGLSIQRLTLRDLPMVSDSAMELFQDLPKVKRLYLHELSVTDAGLKNLENLKELELLDVWTVPGLADDTIDVLATLPNLKELSLRTTGLTDGSIDKILALPALETLTLKDNANISNAALLKLKAKNWKKLDIGNAGK